MVFEMPEEISGQRNRNVLCQCRVIRSKDAKGKEKQAKAQDKDRDQEKATEGQTCLLAASIVDYKFVH